jgi:hypothetical protein
MSAIVRAIGIRGGSRRCAWIALLLGFFASSCVPAHENKEANMFPDHANRVTDPESDLESSLTVLRGGDGGAAAVVVELRNPANADNLVLKVNTEMSAFIMLTVTDQQGTVLSKPARKFNTSDAQPFDIVRIGRGSSHRWRVPIAAQLDASAIPKQGLNGRLVVNVALLFTKVSGNEQPADEDFKSSVLTLHDMDLSFTQAALSEGTKPGTADQSGPAAI